MSRFIKQGVVRDGRGNVINGARVSVFLAGTETPAKIYEEFDSANHVNHVMSDEWGGFKFYVDDTDYDRLQLFTIVLSRQNADDVAWERTPIMQEGIASDVVINQSGSAAGNIAVFSGETGREIVDSGVAPYFHPNHSGDVTSIGDGTTTIADKAVTLAKIADIDSGRILGRVSIGSGVPESLTATQVRSLLNVADGANNYTLPTASPSTLGGVKVGSRLSIVDGVLSADIQDVGGGAVSMGMGDLTDVDLTGLANDNILKYDSANTKWIASVPPAGGGFTAASGAEVDAGTDNTKGVTPKAIHDSGMKIWRELKNWTASTRLHTDGNYYVNYITVTGPLPPEFHVGVSVMSWAAPDQCFSIVRVVSTTGNTSTIYFGTNFIPAPTTILYGGGELAQIVIPVNGKFATTNEYYLLQNYLKFPLIWHKGWGQIVYVVGWCRKTDTGATKPYFNITINGQGVNGDIASQVYLAQSGSLSEHKGLVRPFVNVYLGAQIDVRITAGTNGDAEDFCVYLTVLTH